jgi:tetratricopeptide (TPR) repeat protein
MRVRLVVPKALGGWIISAIVGVAGAATVQPAPTVSDSAVTATIIRIVDMRAAALLTSGQRGGAIDGVLTVGAPAATGEAFRVPFWIELSPPAAVTTDESDQWTLEVFVYAIDALQEVDSFEGRALWLDLGTTGPQQGGVRLHGSIDVSSAVRTLRVLVRDRESGDFYLDHKTVPLVSEASESADALIVFPAAGEAWHEVAPADWQFDTSHSAGPAIGGAKRTPRGRPVIAAPADLDFLVIAGLPAEEIATIEGRLWNEGGAGLDAGELTLAGTLPTAIEGQVAHAVKWRVPDLDPGRYLLELTLSATSSEISTGEILVIVVPPAAASDNPTWVTLAVSPSRRTIPLIGAEALAYLDAVGLCAAGRWTECVEDVYELELRAIRDNGGEKSPADLFALEGNGIATLSEYVPRAMSPLLALHHDVFRVWVSTGDPVGQRHSVRLIAAMANDIRKRPSLEPATSTAVAVLASIGDTLHQQGGFDAATTVFDLALQLDPTHQASLLGTAADHEWLGHHEDTVEVLWDLGQRSDALLEGRLRLGVNLLRTGRHKDAETELRACTGLGAPAWVRAVAYQELALAALEWNRLEEAKSIIDEATEALPEEATLRLLSAYIEETRGNLTEARRVLNQLDQRALSTYRESPRRRYARWPSEIFVEQRGVIGELAEKYLDALASAVAAAAAQPETPGG